MEISLYILPDERSVMGKILVLGLGNEILRDDGIGIRLVHDLAGRGYFPDTDFQTASCGGLEIMELLKGYQVAMIIDGIKTTQGIVGEVHRFSANDFMNTLHLSNLHDIHFLHALRLAQELNIPLPGELHVITVEILEDRMFGNEFTDEIKGEYARILEEVGTFVQQIHAQAVM